MLFMCEMEVRLPADMDPAQADELRAREREYSQARRGVRGAGRTCGASRAATRT